mgnify:CR=1 FL=1
MHMGGKEREGAVMMCHSFFSCLTEDERFSPGWRSSSLAKYSPVDPQDRNA